MRDKLYYNISELTQTGLVKAGISLRSGGVSIPPYDTLNLATHVGDDPKAVSQNQRVFSVQAGIKSIKYCKQIHSDNVIDATTIAPLEWYQEAISKIHKTGDALISSTHNDTIGIFTADCIPIFILDKKTPAIGIAHAGWRGTLDLIATKTLAQMERKFGTIKKNCIVHLGASIKKCCYQVSSDLKFKFKEHFGNSVHNGDRISLQIANRIQLVDFGVHPKAISNSPYCTACNTDKFFSYRAESGQTGRMLSFIQLTRNI